MAASTTAIRKPARPATDDEILGIVTDPANARHAATRNGSPSDAESSPESMDDQPASSPDASADSASDVTAHDGDDDSAAPESQDASANEARDAALAADPELRQAWEDAHSYRQIFATPEEARAATALIADLDRLDALFFSPRPEDHAELARAVAQLDPKAFASAAQAMAAHAATMAPRQSEEPPAQTTGRGNADSTAQQQTAPQHAPEQTTAKVSQQPRGFTPAQAEFFHSANAAAVQSVLDAIETQVDRLLPEGVSKSARNRVVGEVYRELDASLTANRQLAQQVREAFRAGSLDAAHQRAIVSLITGRARQALPGVAKRVLNEWTSSVVAANHERRARQRNAERRVDIAGAGRTGSDAPHSLSPRDIDYARLSDSDILNL